MGEAVLLSIAGAIILILLGVIGNLYLREWKRQDEDKQTLSKVMSEGFTKLESLIGGVAAQAQRLERDCVTWEDLGKELGPLKAGQVNHGERLVALETNCKAEHGK